MKGSAAHRRLPYIPAGAILDFILHLTPFEPFPGDFIDIPWCRMMFSSYTILHHLTPSYTRDDNEQTAASEELTNISQGNHRKLPTISAEDREKFHIQHDLNI
jgi:hypothetical protein